MAGASRRDIRHYANDDEQSQSRGASSMPLFDLRFQVNHPLCRPSPRLSVTRSEETGLADEELGRIARYRDTKVNQDVHLNPFGRCLEVSTKNDTAKRRRHASLWNFSDGLNTYVQTVLRVP